MHKNVCPYTWPLLGNVYPLDLGDGNFGRLVINQNPSVLSKPMAPENIINN